MARTAALIDLSVVAIGGITVSGLPALRVGGLVGAAVVSAICMAEDPRSVAADLHRAWDEGCRR